MCMQYLFFSFLIICIFIFSSCYTSKMYSRASFPHHTDTSFVYRLPVLNKNKVYVSQGYYGVFSHRRIFALDFRLKMNTPVCAARSGIVVGTEWKHNRGGATRKWIDKANYVEIKHDDGTWASYWHLQYNGVIVKNGDRVEVGQLIGYSGNTGFSTMPHLHFELWGIDEMGYKTFPSFFYVSGKRRILQGGRSYRIIP